MIRSFCGVDLGGTTINMGVVTDKGQVVLEKQVLSHVDRGADYVVEQIVTTVHDFMQRGENQFELGGLGIGVAGLVDSKNGLLRQAANFPKWIDVPLTFLLSSRLNLRVTLENDANVAALGEYRYGAGVGCPFMMMVTLGTGVGSGLILNGEIYRGANGVAGEFGHITIDYQGERCACGRKGCVEAYVGTRGILRQAESMCREYPRSSLAALDQRAMTPKIIYEHACAGDEAAIKVFEHVGQLLGIGMGNVVNLLDIQQIIIGGGVAMAGDLIINSARLKLQESALDLGKEPPRIAKARLGSGAGVIGAATLAMTMDSL